jgi:hypothetical protein
MAALPSGEELLPFVSKNAGTEVPNPRNGLNCQKEK